MIPLRPGRHRVELRNGSFPAYIETVELKPGTELSITHRFRAKGAMAVYRSLASLLVCLVMAGCGTFSSKGETELGFGIRAFEDGEHVYAARLLQLSLDAGLRGTSNRASAHNTLHLSIAPPAGFSSAATNSKWRWRSIPHSTSGTTRPDTRSGSRIPRREAEEIARP